MQLQTNLLGLIGRLHFLSQYSNDIINRPELSSPLTNHNNSTN